jgi:hypothetical protein
MKCLELCLPIFFIKLNIEMPRKLSKEAKKAVEELRREGI